MLTLTKEGFACYFLCACNFLGRIYLHLLMHSGAALAMSLRLNGRHAYCSMPSPEQPQSAALQCQPEQTRVSTILDSGLLSAGNHQNALEACVTSVSAGTARFVFQ
jgi:hypothetical protein